MDIFAGLLLLALVGVASGGLLVIMLRFVEP